MPHYLKPLRRKIGVLTLVLACLFAAGWIRSFSVYDGVTIQTGRQTLGGVISAQGTVVWLRNNFHDQQAMAGIPRYQSFEIPEGQNVFDDPDLKWTWRIYGLGSGGAETSALRSTFIAVPHGSIVIPLTLLSAWLLLSKPRTKIEPPIERKIETT